MANKLTIEGIRREAGITVTRLCIAAQMTPQTYSIMRRGTPVRYETARAFITALNRLTGKQYTFEDIEISIAGKVYPIEPFFFAKEALSGTRLLLALSEDKAQFETIGQEVCVTLRTGARKIRLDYWRFQIILTSGARLVESHLTGETRLYLDQQEQEEQHG